MEFYEHLKTYLKDDEIVSLKEALSKRSEHALLLNTDKLSQESLLKLFPSLKKHPIVDHAFIYDKEELDLGKSIYHALGCFYLQEPSAMLPAFLLKPSEDDIVLDLCAAPGGKSMQASLLMNNQGLIIANDISRSRAYAISENAERLGRGNLLITNNDFSLIFDNYQNFFDKIILDAPCSGSGMFRKENKMLEDWSYQKVIKYSEIQKQLVLMCYSMLKPGGTMVYSTCSFSYEEDEEVIKHLLSNTDATLLAIPHSDLYYVSQDNLGIHLLPSLFPGEGHYIALINKPGELKKNVSKDINKNNYHVNGSYPNIQKYGSYLYTMSELIKIKNLNVIRYGVKIGELVNNTIKYDHHFAHFVKRFENEQDINLEQLMKYYQGESLNINIPKGDVLLKYEGINVDITKSDGRIIKNHLPKGLRKKFIV